MPCGGGVGSARCDVMPAVANLPNVTAHGVLSCRVPGLFVGVFVVARPEWNAPVRCCRFLLLGLWVLLLVGELVGARGGRVHARGLDHLCARTCYLDHRALQMKWFDGGRVEGCLRD
ncbi:hypothetical protein IWX49DRAFT_577152, partial [Phyllosticta citricarpa]